jgi:hypothetical protein
VYGDLYEGPAVRLAQIDGLRHVIYVGSYTKLIGPALRVGFIVAEAAPESTSVENLVRRARDQSILLAKGSLFSPFRGCCPRRGPCPAIRRGTRRDPRKAATNGCASMSLTPPRHRWYDS